MGGIDWQQGATLSTGGSALIGVSVTLSVLQIFFVIARFYTRSLQHTQCGADDYVMLVALTGSLAKAVIFIVLVEVAGFGHHDNDLAHPIRDISLMKKGVFVLELLDFPFTVTPAKISLLLFYVRIFYMRILYTRKFQIIPYTIGVLVLGLGITVFFETIFQCSPIEHGWNPNIQGTCINQSTFYRAISPINVLTGLMLLVLPIPLVWSLHARRVQKVALTGVFLLSGLGTVVSILRMAIWYTSPRAELNDRTWFSIKLGIISMAESAIIVIATCLVSIGPLVTHFMPRSLPTKIACCRSRRSPQHEHEQWYSQTIQAERKSVDYYTYEGNYIQREVSWSSRPSSLAELEDQRSWILGDEDEGPRHHPWVSYEVHITAGV